jgi:hypothetical protein
MLADSRAFCAAAPCGGVWYAGLWLLTRKKVDGASTNTMLQRLNQMGFDTSVLKPVNQSGCTYRMPAVIVTPARGGSTTPTPATTPTPPPVAATPRPAPTPSPKPAAAAGKPTDITDRVYLDIQQGTQNLGRIVLGLYGNAAPRTVANFKALATGEYGFGYANSIFHRIIEDFMVQVSGQQSDLPNCAIIMGSC